MKYYVVADPHGFYTEMREALEEKGFFQDEEPHKLIVCGDLMDRGEEALKMQDFILDLMEKDQVILVQGNHEDLMLKLLHGWYQGSYRQMHHIHNGTLDTACQLSYVSKENFGSSCDSVLEGLFFSPFIRKIIPAMVDYYETDHYIFTHGWIPSKACQVNDQETIYIYEGDWRQADEEEWSLARWYNGMEAAHCGAFEPGKTIICGHWHTSFGHARYEEKCGEFSEDADFSPYYAEGIIALDGCTAYTHKVNCIVIED